MLGRPTDTEWVNPDPPPIPERIRREVGESRTGPGGDGHATTVRKVRDRVGAWLSARGPGEGRGLRGLPLVMLVSGLVVVLGGVGLWISGGPFDAAARRHWVSLCNDYGRWYGAFAEGIGDRDRETFERVGLISVFNEVRAARPMDPRVIAGRPDSDLQSLRDQPPASARTASAIRQTRDAALAVQRVAETFKQWPVLGELKAQRKTLSTYGFDTAAGLLQRMLVEAPPYGPPPPGPKLEEMVTVQRWAGQAAALLPQLDADVRELAQHGDTVFALLQLSYDAARQHGVDPTRADPRRRLEALANHLRTLHAFAQRMRVLTESPAWARIDHAEFRRTGRAYAMLAPAAGSPTLQQAQTPPATASPSTATPSPSTAAGVDTTAGIDATDPDATERVFRAWLTEAEAFEQLGEDWRTAWAQAQRARLAAATRAGAALQPTNPTGARAWGEARERLEARIDELLGQPLISGRAGDLDRRRQSLERDITELVEAADRAVNQADVLQTAAALRAQTQLGDRSFASPAVDEVWRVVCDLAAGELERDGEVEAARARLQVARQRLLGLIDPERASALPALPSLEWENIDASGRRLVEALENGLTVARDQALRSALPAPAGAEAVGGAGHVASRRNSDMDRASAIDEAAWARALDAYRQLHRQAVGLAGAARHIQRLWDRWEPLRGPDAAADGGQAGGAGAGDIDRLGAGLAWAESLDRWRDREVWGWPGVGVGAAGAPAVGDAGSAEAPGAAAALWARVEGLRAIARMREPALLEDLVLASREPAYAFAAWRRRGELAWNGGVEALATERRMQRRLLELISWRSDRDRREALVAELAAARPERWRAALRDADARSPQVTALAAADEAWGVDHAALPPTLTSKLRLAELRDRLASPPPGVEPALHDARTLAMIQAFVLQADNRAADRELLQDLRDAVADQEADPAAAAQRVRRALGLASGDRSSTR